MTANFTADDLRALADALDQMSQATGRTDVKLWGYEPTCITYQDHVMRVNWQDAQILTTAQTTAGRYVLEIPDKEF